MEEAEYRKLAVVEDRMWYFRALHRLIEQELARELPSGDLRLLDAGCGTGGLIRRLGSRHSRWHWTGIDLSPVACAYARERTSVEIHEGSVEALPFESGAFDAVVMADVLYHVEGEGAALRESLRVLKPGGLMIVNVPAYPWLWSYHDLAVHSIRRYTRKEILGKFRDSGFGRARATYWNTLPFPLVVVRRKLLPPPRGGSDVRLYPAPVEAAFNALMGLERIGLSLFSRLPFGSSVLAVARKD